MCAASKCWKRAVKSAGMLADAQSVDDALVAGPMAETAPAADELEGALRHLSQCSQSQQAASQLASQTLSQVVAGPAGAANLSPQTQGTLSGGAADVPTSSTASTLPAAAPVPAEWPVPPALADCKPCGLKPPQAGVIKALCTPHCAALRAYYCSISRLRPRGGRWLLTSKQVQREPCKLHCSSQTRPRRRTVLATALLASTCWCCGSGRSICCTAAARVAAAVLVQRQRGVMQSTSTVTCCS